MAKREKRLERGIESLEKQKKIHMEKRKIAEEINLFCKLSAVNLTAQQISVFTINKLYYIRN